MLTCHEEVSVDRVSVNEEGNAVDIGEENISVPVVEDEVVVEKRPVVQKWCIKDKRPESEGGMMNRNILRVSRTKRQAALVLPTMALFALFSIVALAGCGGGGNSSSSSSGGGETTSSSRAGGETTASKAGGETTSAASGETTVDVNLTNATLDLTPSRDSGVNGTAVLTDNPGALVVTLNMQNLGTAPGTEHLADIHEGGTCEDDQAENGAPVEYVLNPVVTQPDGSGSSTTILEGVSLEQLETGTEKYVDVKAERTRGDVVPPGIACANIPFIIP